MRYKIKKAKITKGRTVEVELTEINDDNTENEVSKKCSQLYHNDLEAAFDKLKFHLAHLCDTKESDLLSDLSEQDNTKTLEKIKVSSFSVSEANDGEGACLVGSRKLNGNKVLNLVSPFQPYDSEEDGYQYGSELAVDIQTCIYEVEQYLFEGKYAVKQLELDFDEHKEKDEFELDKETSDVAREVLSRLGDSILEPKSKSRKKDKIIQLVPADSMAESQEAY